jgi:hypothetical protein
VDGVHPASHTKYHSYGAQPTHTFVGIVGGIVSAGVETVAALLLAETSGMGIVLSLETA